MTSPLDTPQSRGIFARFNRDYIDGSLALCLIAYIRLDDGQKHNTTLKRSEDLSGWLSYVGFAIECLTS